MSSLPPPHPSLWMATSRDQSWPALDGDVETDVAIIGAGITGISVAWRLKQAGMRVVVVESHRVAGSTTGYTTAKVTSLHGLTYARLRGEAGDEAARHYAEANETAIQEIARIVDEEDVHCDFRRAPAYTYATNPSHVGEIEAEVEAAQTAGLPASFTTDTELPFDVAGAIRVGNQAMFHPRAYCLTLADRINGDGSRVYEHTRAIDVSTGDPCEVITRHGRVRAGHVVLATHIPFLDRGGFFARVSPSRSYALAARIDGPMPEGMYLGVGENGYSVRPYRGQSGDYLIIGGEGHKVGQEEDTRLRYAGLETWARETYPVSGIVYSWSAQDYMPVDGVPYIGKLTPMSNRIYIATGFKKWGLSTGMIAAMLIEDALLGRENRWQSTFDSTRIDITRSAKTFIRENMDVATRFVWDRISRINAGPADELAPDTGGIVDINGDTTAAYRDRDGTLHAVSPTCAHLGCSLTWNTAERSWDCPCHGSRYDVDGTVIQGPSVRDLERREMPTSSAGGNAASD